MTKDRVNEIDLLRFIAAIAVVFFHYTFRGYAADGLSPMPYPWFAPVSKYGYLGVHLFFMISGFVILMTAAGGVLKDFVISRMVRLYPAFWACCTATVVTAYFLGAGHFAVTPRQYLVNMTMLSGFLNVPSVDGAYWSLFEEMKFYALVAVVLVLGKIARAQVFLAGWLLVSVALETVFQNRNLHYYLVVDYAAFFIAGATYYLVWQRGPSLGRVGLLAASWGLAVYQLLRGLAGFERHYATTLSAGVAVGIVSAFYLVFALIALRRTGFIGRRRWLTAGAITYPLYLLHENIGFMIFGHAYPALNPHVLLGGTIVLMLLAAYGVNRLVERPLAPLMKRALLRACDTLVRMVPMLRPRA